VTSRPDLVKPRIIAIANQKGGVGKTTTAINLAAALAAKGHATLLVDLDPQGNASTGLGVAPADRRITTYDLLVLGQRLSACVQPTSTDGLSIVPANSDLSSADFELSKRTGRTSALRAAFANDAETARSFDFIVLDCPPTLSLLTINALIAAHTVLIPLQAEFFALEGLSQLMLTVREVRQNGNPDLRLEGIVLTMYDGRNRLSQQVEDDVRATLGDLVFNTRVPRNVRLSEAQSFAMPIFTYDIASRGSQAYLDLADEVLNRYHTANPAVGRENHGSQT
jgi:chromosome partitioning protein